MKLRSILQISLVMILALSMTSCGSSKKNNSSSASDEMSQSDNSGDGASADANFVLNGDSDSGKAGGLNSVYFAYDSSMLTGEAKSNLEGNVEFLKANPGVEIQIEGHCDERGGVQYNIALGEKRARAVKDYMSAMGVAESRMSTVSYGKERPLEFGHSEGSWSRNRRANFVITAK